MQLQMEVCDLNECDFLETKFIEYENYNDFINDGSFKKTESNKHKGIFILFFHNGKPHYEYPPINIEEKSFDEWEQNIIEKNHQMQWIKNIYWKLEIISCVLVLRNKLWFKSAIQKIGDVWNTIEKEKVSGYQHRAPKKRKKSFDEKEKKTGCLLKFENKQIVINTIHVDTPPLKIS